MADPRTTGYISLFEPPEEDPLREDGAWAMAFGVTPSGNDLDMRKYQEIPGSGLGHATNQHHGTTLSGPIGRSFWTRERFSGDCEVWGIPYGGQLGAALETWRLFLWADPITAPKGYLVYIGGGIGKDTVIRRYDGGGASDYTVLASDSRGYATGLCLVINGDDVEAWGSTGSPSNPANWVMRCSATDTTYRDDLYLGMAIEDPTNGGLSFTAIGGGHRRKRQQIYRRLSN